MLGLLAQNGGTTAAPNPFISFAPLLLLGLVFYFLLIRPQQRRVRQQRDLVDSLGVGDEVVTIGGIYGRIQALQEDVIDLEVSPGTSVRVARQAVRQRITG